MPAPPHPQESLDALARDGLLRKLAPLDGGAGPVVGRDGREMVNFSSNDYLGLARHPQVVAAMVEGVAKYGVGATASRLVCGSLPAHHALEEMLADAKGGEAALTFSSGYATAMGGIPAIVGKHDTVVLDKLSHACLVDAARLSGATLRVFPHNHVDRLASMLAKIRARQGSGRLLVITESVFSMDGDVCPLGDILDICERFDAMLWLDEAHATGVLGPGGLGLARQPEFAGRVHFQMGTLGKALGVAGGFLVATRPWIELMVNRARAFVYSTAPPAALAHAAIAALRVSQSTEGDGLRATLRGHLDAFGMADHPSAIIPVILKSNDNALAASRSMTDAGFLVPAIRYPTVPRGTARLRISLSAAHSRESIHNLRLALEKTKSGLANHSRENP